MDSNFVSLHFIIRIGDSNEKYALPRWRLNVETKTKARCTAVADSVLMNSRTQKILCCIVAILFSTDAAARRAL